jgi:lipopolysaccharide transport system ATP-binding protein
MSFAVRFEGVSKRYRLGVLGAGSLRSALTGLFARGAWDDRRVLWALKDVSFTVAPGEGVGLVGANGAGKSTALRLIAGITRPTEGTIRVNGRLATLLELGSGFHPELTGRENIFLYGSILGLKRREVQQAFDSIVAFSELERFLDTPLKRYSSGMYVRLAFAVAAHIEPDILLVDEVLAVGDAGFRQKCLDRMRALRRGGTTLLFVSHNAHMVQAVCERAVHLQQGQVVGDGSAEEVMRAYERTLRRLAMSDRRGGKQRVEMAVGAIEIMDVSAVDAQGQPRELFDYTDTAKIQVRYRAREAIIQPILHVRLWRDDNTPCFTVRSNQPSSRLGGFTLAGEGSFALNLTPLQLHGGSYRAEVVVVDSTNTTRLAMGHSPWFRVDGPGNPTKEKMGVYVPMTSWEVNGVDFPTVRASP